jgi:hypothetical protein
MSEYLPFWPKAGVGAYFTNDAETKYVYSRALPTNGFTEVVVQMGIDAAFGGNAASSIKATPQISNDGVNWKDITSTLTILANATFPEQKTEKFTEIGAFMRIRIELYNKEGATKFLMGPVMVSGAGRS